MLKSLQLLTLLGFFVSQPVQAFDLKIKSFRVKLAKPATFHSLVYKDPNVNIEKTIFDLSPRNNERLGFFVDLNGILLGYSFDPFSADLETKTTDIILSLEKFRNSKLILNYQILDGFETKAIDVHGDSEESDFLEKTRSTKFEIFALHNLYTLKGTSLFNHFFLNKPQKSSHYSYALSLVGGWNFRRLKLSNPENLIFEPSFFNNAPLTFNKINAYSVSASTGPMFSMGLKNNFNLFAESKLGVGFFKNLSPASTLKKSGTEFIYSYGGGASWTSNNEKTLIILKIWEQTGRHIKTIFGDLSLVYFF